MKVFQVITYFEGKGLSREETSKYVSKMKNPSKFFNRPNFIEVVNWNNFNDINDEDYFPTVCCNNHRLEDVAQEEILNSEDTTTVGKWNIKYK